jgi:hypothetical protein
MGSIALAAGEPGSFNLAAARGLARMSWLGRCQGSTGSLMALDQLVAVSVCALVWFRARVRAGLPLDRRLAAHRRLTSAHLIR